MLEIHRDLDARFRKYVIINSWTGLPCNRDGKIFRHFTIRGAVKRRNHINRQFHNTVRSVSRG